MLAVRSMLDTTRWRSRHHPSSFENRRGSEARLLQQVENHRLRKAYDAEVGPPKGQLISKAIYSVLDSPKKRTKKI